MMLACAVHGARFAAVTLDERGGGSWELRDSQTGAMARIDPTHGNECTILRLPGSDGKLVDLLSPPPGSQSGMGQGIPILFPYPGRINGDQYEFLGKQLKLAPRPGSSAAMHGFVQSAKWRVEQAQADDNSARLICRIEAADCPDQARSYPFSWGLRVCHELSADGLMMRVTVGNGGTSPMPFGFGLHPWFRVPLGAAGDAGSCTFQVPARKYWNWEALEGLTPTSATLPAASWQAEASAEKAVDAPTRVTDRATVLYTGLQPNGAAVESRINDPVGGLELVMQSDPKLATIVVFKARGGGSLCLEPWSCPVNVFNAATQGVPDNGLVVLQPQQIWETWVRFGVRPVRTTAQP